MRVLIGDTWRSGFLDPWRAPGELRIEVRKWIVVQQLDDLFLEQPYDVRRVIDYTREVGPVEVARKVLSRLSETWRNDKFVACGLGVDLESGDAVAFFAPYAPRAVERVVLPPDLVWSADDVPSALEVGESWSNDFEAWSGWVRESGRALHDLEELRRRVFAVVAADAERVRLEPTEIAERRGEPVEGERQRVSVFGFGHYVRTMVLTSLPKELEVVAVHELDPVLAPDSFPTVDTCPNLRPGESPDVVIVAGFHHSHAAISAESLRRGAAVICEKPLATTEPQLENLLAEWSGSTTYFASFQRRFIPANSWVLKDLGVSKSNPMSYHALVHEVSLPAGHWYHWPSSGSRMLSNGCHWVDHFLWLNDFSTVIEARSRRGPNDELLAELTLENGAFFTMTLTHRGSDRLGVREHTEIRVGDRTAVIEDMSSYVCEGPRGVIRREKFPRLGAHRAMYAEFARRIVAGEPGDSKRSVEVSTRAVLELERQLSH